MNQMPGWYIDAMEQGMGVLIAQQRVSDRTVEELAEFLADPTSAEGSTLTPEQHTETLALCLAICIRRLARIDMPT